MRRVWERCVIGEIGETQGMRRDGKIGQAREIYETRETREMRRGERIR
jgi:hypothetical protein